MILRLDRYIRYGLLAVVLILPLCLAAVEYNIHRVQRGDTLYGLSRRYGVSIDHIKRLNNLTGDNLQIGQRLKISEIRQTPPTPTPTPVPTPAATLRTQSAPPVSTPPPQNLPPDFYHIVNQGEGLYRIAVNNSITLAELLRFNGFANSSVPIKPGDRIIIKDPATANRSSTAESDEIDEEDTDTEANPPTGPRPNAASTAAGDTVVVEQVYIVQRGDNLYRIAVNHGLSLDELKRRNNLSSNDIYVGQRLYIVGSPSNRPVSPAAPVIEGESETLRTDLAMPVEGTLTSPYGIRNGRPHKGVDLAARTGTPIKAVLDGTVVFSGVQGGYGNVIVLEHPDFVMTIYAHNERNLVSVGDTVTKGQQIATVGSTGDSSGPHLHFEYRIKGKPINPARVLPLE